VARAAAAFCMLLAMVPAVARAADSVAISLSEPGGAYADVAAALRAALPSGVAVVQGGPVPDMTERPRLAVAVGVGACAQVARQGGAPALCALVPKAAFEAIAADPQTRRTGLSALYLDQPPGRQMALVRLVLPRVESLSMLLGPDSAASEPAFASAAARHGLRTAFARASGPEDLYPALQRLLEGGEALLALPDARVFNAGTAQNILRAAIRARVPMFAFSPAYVRAGALAAVHTTPQQVGRHAGMLAREFLAGRPLPAAQYPSEFTVTANVQVARSLGLDLPAEDELAARLRATEATMSTPR